MRNARRQGVTANVNVNTVILNNLKHFLIKVYVNSQVLPRPGSAFLGCSTFTPPAMPHSEVTYRRVIPNAALASFVSVYQIPFKHHLSECR